MTHMICASAPRLEGAFYRLPFGVAYIVVAPAEKWRAALMRLVRRPAEMMRNRRAVALLATMDARQLADIGLTRADVIDAADIGAFGHPMTVLSLRAAERAAHDLGRGARRA